MTFQVLGSTSLADGHQAEVYLAEPKPAFGDDSLYHPSDSKPQHGSQTTSCLGKYVWYLSLT